VKPPCEERRIWIELASPVASLEAAGQVVDDSRMTSLVRLD
jgi:hypothetical protein